MPLAMSKPYQIIGINSLLQPNVIIHRSSGQYVLGTGNDGEWEGPFTDSDLSNAPTGTISDNADRWMSSKGINAGNARTFVDGTPKLAWEDNNVDAMGAGGNIAYDKTLGRWLYVEDPSNSWYSTDYGDTWNAGGTPANGFAGNFNDRHTAIVTTGGQTQVFVSGQNRVQYTDDGAASWTAVTNANFTIGALTYEPTDDRLYITLTGDGITSQRGVWYIPRTSLGGAWTQDLNANGMQALECNHTNGTLVAISDNADGVWRKAYGGSWTAVQAISPNGVLRMVTYVPQVDRWLAWDSGDNQVWTSDDDGLTFTLDATFPGFSSNGTAYIEHRTRAFINDF